MSSLFLKLVNMAMAAGWLVLAVIAVRFLFKRAPRWLLCALWAVAALRLVCPVTVESAVSLVPSAQVIPADILTDYTFDVTTGVEAVDTPVNDYLGDHYYEGVTVPAGAGFDFMETMGWLWLAGAAGIAGYGLVSYLRLRRRVRVSLPLWENIYLCDDIATPFILGVARPRIYLPSGMEESVMACVLRHEEAHLRRRDHWWKVLGYGLLAVYWFHPLVWLGYALFCRDMEAACDEKVIRAMDGEGRAAGGGVPTGLRRDGGQGAHQGGAGLPQALRAPDHRRCGGVRRGGGVLFDRSRALPSGFYRRSHRQRRQL